LTVRGNYARRFSLVQGDLQGMNIREREKERENNERERENE